MDFTNDFDFENRILSTKETSADAEPEVSLRPRRLRIISGRKR